MKPTKAFQMLCPFALLFSAGSAHAYTECSGYVTAAFVGADGLLWITFAENQHIATTASGPAADRIFATVMTALSGRMRVTFRLAADGISCASTTPRTDLAGLWIYAS